MCKIVVEFLFEGGVSVIREYFYASSADLLCKLRHDYRGFPTQIRIVSSFFYKRRCQNVYMLDYYKNRKAG